MKLLIFLCTLQLFAIVIAFKSLKPESREYFLPNTSIPWHYELDLDVFLGPDYYYNGTVDIYFELFEERQNLILHSNDLKIDVNNSYVFHKFGFPVRVISAVETEYNNFLNVTLAEKLTPGQHVLKLFFIGNYYTYANGLFLSSYGKKYMLATQFEPIQARAMFPCFDEPDLKATFRLRVTHPNNLNAISNTEIDIMKAADQNRTSTTFKITPTVSTYLIALAVSDFETLEAEFKGRKVHMFVPPGNKQYTKFALNVSVESLKHFENLLKINYTLPKLDGISVPTFGGGMENWGLIVYGPSVIVKNPSINLMGTINLLCHEIAHQWFGNLVTLKWWDYVWLNEGFATYYAARIGDMIFNNYRFMDNHVVSLQRLMAEDSFSTESLNQHVEIPNTIRPKFNNIGYQKGSAIVRFMHLFFSGYDLGITSYLKKHSFGNVEPRDLFEAINTHSNNLPENLTVKSVMKNWVEYSGHPLITVDTTSRDHDFVYLGVTQEHLTSTGRKSNNTWWIPISYTTENEHNFNISGEWPWLSDSQTSGQFNVAASEKEWILVNLQAGVFCHVNYDVNNWKRIISFLHGSNFKKIHVLNRAQLVSDANFLAKIGKLPENIVWELLSYLEHEDDELVHRASHSIFIQYRELLKESSAYPNFKKFVFKIYANSKWPLNLTDPDMRNLVEDALSESGNRFDNSGEALQKISERMYDESIYNKIKSLTKSRARSMTSYKESVFLNDIRKQFEYNMILKKNFYKNGYHKEAETWLNNHF